MSKHWKRRAWDFGFPWVAALARSRWHRMTRGLMRGLGAMTLRIQGGRRQNATKAIGREWQRMFPSRKMVPIVQEDDTTVIANITAACPLRGTGDTAACYRMMEYDRRMLETIGGQLVVLHSQAEPGRTHCEVAIRAADASMDDLVAAHVRTGADVK